MPMFATSSSHKSHKRVVMFLKPFQSVVRYPSRFFFQLVQDLTLALEFTVSGMDVVVKECYPVD